MKYKMHVISMRANNAENLAYLIYEKFNKISSVLLHWRMYFVLAIERLYSEMKGKFF